MILAVEGKFHGNTASKSPRVNSPESYGKTVPDGTPGGWHHPGRCQYLIAPRGVCFWCGCLFREEGEPRRGVGIRAQRRRKEEHRYWKGDGDKGRTRLWIGYRPARGVGLEHESKQARGSHQGRGMEVTLVDVLPRCSVVSWRWEKRMKAQVPKGGK